MLFFFPQTLSTLSVFLWEAHWITKHLASAVTEISAALMVFRGRSGEIGKKNHGDEARRWTGSFLPTVLSGGSIALSRRSDLGLTPALERLGLVSSASFTISRKLYPTLASSPSTQAHRGHVTQFLFAALRNPLKLLGWKIMSLSWWFPAERWHVRKRV